MSRETGASNSLMSLDKRSKIMLAVLAAVLVIAAAYFLVFKKSSHNNNATGPVKVPAAGASAKPSASAAPKVTPQPSPSPVVTADSTRDPFQPLAQEVAATTSASPGATSTPSASPSSASPSSPAATGSHSVQLVSITGTTASVSYNGAPAQTVKAGSTLAPGVTVVKIDVDSIIVGYANKVYAVAPNQTVSF